MDDTSSLEEEFEQDLLLEPDEPPPASTPRQRLEDARAMAEGNCDVSLGGEGDLAVPESVDRGAEEPDTSMHLLQRLSCAMADSGEWKCFHDITQESQLALAEMNETLGALRQWQKQRKVDPSPSVPSSLEDAPRTVVAEKLLSENNPSHPLGCSSEPVTTLTMDKPVNSVGGNTDASGPETLHNELHEGALGDGEQQDPLLVLWQEHHLRAQQAVGRLQEQLGRHPPSLSLKTGDVTDNVENVENGKVDKTTAETHENFFSIRNLLAGGGAAESSSGNGGNTDTAAVDRLAELSRNVDGLQIHQWIQTTRTHACDRAETLAREACEDIRQGAGSAAVGEMEGELDGFAQELDSLLLRIDRIDNDNRGEEGHEGNEILPLGAPRVPHGGLAPAADAQVDGGVSSE